MKEFQTDASNPGWVKGWIVMRVKQNLPGDFVSVHAHAEQAQEEARLRGSGYQVFHGSHKLGSDEFHLD